MALDYIQPAVQVRRVAKLLELVAIRVKRGEVPESLESSLEIELSALEISPPSVITVSRGDCFAKGLVRQAFPGFTHDFPGLNYRPSFLIMGHSIEPV